ncbi:MAG TPA: RsmE family RNA methyltransferase [Ginsengibacter sp.]|nr:RsmE family RNA methyltransferase [Ginsengibacter sp.]
MQLPFFFEENLPREGNFILNEETSRHIAQVLRMHENENLLLTNGKGQVLTAAIVKADKKNTEVQIINKSEKPKQFQIASIAISLIKNTSRFEWFLEKATEIGVSEIIPLVCERTEKQHFRYDRMKNIIVSAMLQSRQVWLPVLHEPSKFNAVITDTRHQNKFIAHCVDDKKQQLRNEAILKGETIILIGPEGDFTKDEIAAAVQNNFIPVSLGETRLRTETAGIVAAVLLLNR